jgi:hypothetical protein
MPDHFIHPILGYLGFPLSLIDIFINIDNRIQPSKAEYFLNEGPLVTKVQFLVLIHSFHRANDDNKAA